jgi:hypothetical protein
VKIVKRLSLLVLCFFALTILAYAQADSDIGTPNPTQIGVDSAQQKLREVSVSKFEDAGFWYSAMSMDDGIATLRRFQGSPQDKEPIPGEEEAKIEEKDAYVLGLKIQYFSRGPKVFAIFPVRPLPVEGVCKTISVWVVGRNFNHVLKVILEDQFGNNAEITMGKLNFSGWKKLTVAVPPSLKQRDYHFSNKLGIKVKGFKVETDPAESYGTYYIYFDDMRAVTDLFAEEDRDVDDMVDSW